MRISDWISDVCSADLTVKDSLAEAHERIPSITPAQAAEMMEAGEALVVDVRDAPEVQQSGKVKGAINVSRGLLEFRADPENPMHHPDFQKDRSEEHTSELQSLMRISYAVFCLKKKTKH